MDNRVHPYPAQRPSAGSLEFQRKNTDIEGRKKTYLKLTLRFLIISCVVSDSIIAVLQTIPFISQKHGFVLYICEQIFLIVFALETPVRWCNGFKMFWRSWLNIMNLLITLTVFVGHLATSDPDALTIFRCLRLTRLILCHCSLQEMDTTLKAIVRSLLEMKIFFLISMAAILAFAVAGIDMFSTLPSAFENLSLTFYTLFVFITQDSWMDIYKLLQEDEMGNTFWTLLYFITCILYSSLVLSIFDAWIQGNVKVAHNPQDEQEHLTDNASIKDLTLDVKPEAVDNVQEEVVVEKTNKRRPLNSELVTVMLAIKRKMDEKTIKQELKKATAEIVQYDHPEIIQIKETDTLENMVNKEMATGDIISTIINLSNAHLLDADTDSPHLIQNNILKARAEEDPFLTTLEDHNQSEENLTN